MTRWIDAPDWHDATADLLHETLREAYYRMNDLIELYSSVGLRPNDFAWEGTARVLWPSITRDCAGAGKLEDLIVLVRDARPATGPALTKVLAAQVSGGNWYRSAERHLSHLLGPGCGRAMLDRLDLRTHLRDLADGGFPVLSITGDPGSGKSYSRHLIQHIASDPLLNCDFRIIDVADEFYDRVDSLGFMTALANRLGMTGDFAVDPHVEESRKVRELVDIFVGRYAQLPSRLRWIFIDGLDRPTVQSGVRIAVARLAKEVESGQLPATRLIVTGHPGDFAPAVMEVLRHEQLGDVTPAHVHGFFKGVARHVGKEISEQHLSLLVHQVLEEAELADLSLLGRTACKAAHAHFSPAAGS